MSNRPPSRKVDNIIQCIALQIKKLSSASGDVLLQLSTVLGYCKKMELEQW